MVDEQRIEGVRNFREGLHGHSARTCELHHVIRVPEQLHAKSILDGVHMPGKLGLGHEEFCRSRREVPMLGQHEHFSHVGYVHVRPFTDYDWIIPRNVTRMAPLLSRGRPIDIGMLPDMPP